MQKLHIPAECCFVSTEDNKTIFALNCIDRFLYRVAYVYKIVKAVPLVMLGIPKNEYRYSERTEKVRSNQGTRRNK